MVLRNPCPPYPTSAESGYETFSMPSARRERMLREMPPDPVAPFDAVIRCSARVAALILLAAIGPSVTDFHTFAGSGSHVRGAESASEGMRAAAHRKALFDERRTRFNGVARERPTANSQRLSEA